MGRCWCRGAKFHALSVLSREAEINQGVGADAPAARYTLWSTRSDSLGNKIFDQTNIFMEVTK